MGIIIAFCCLGYCVYKKRRHAPSGYHFLERSARETDISLATRTIMSQSQVPEVVLISAMSLREREKQRLQQETEERSKCVAM